MDNTILWFGKEIRGKPYCFGLPERSHINRRDPELWVGGWCDSCQFFEACQMASDYRCPPKILVLGLKRRYYDDIASGKKKEEYRECKPYWEKRIAGKNFDVIEFRLGTPEREDSSRHMYFRFAGVEYTNMLWLNEQDLISRATIVIKIGDRLDYPYQAMETGEPNGLAVVSPSTRT